MLLHFSVLLFLPLMLASKDVKTDQHGEAASSAGDESGVVGHKGDPHWVYEPDIEGPANGGDKTLDPFHWQNAYPSCAGQSQSPINIRRDEISERPFMEKIQFVNYHNLFRNLTVTNNGHTIKVRFDTKPYARIAQGELEDVYVLMEAHFHWGPSSVSGSEHWIAGIPFPCEVHMVHVKQKYLKNIFDSVNDDEAFAVLGSLCKIVKEDNKDLMEFFVAVKKIPYQGDEYQMKMPFQPKYFLPINTNNYYRYVGSLTTPPCSQQVIWTLFVDQLEISEKQLESMRRVYETETLTVEIPLMANARPPQPLNKRKVYVRNIKEAFPVENSSQTRFAGHIGFWVFIVTSISQLAM